MIDMLLYWLGYVTKAEHNDLQHILHERDCQVLSLRKRLASADKENTRLYARATNLRQEADKLHELVATQKAALEHAQRKLAIFMEVLGNRNKGSEKGAEQ